MAEFFIKKSVGIIRLNFPPVNGLGLAVRQGIIRGLEQADKNKCRAVLLTGSGKSFSAGADITEFTRGLPFQEPNLGQVIGMLDGFQLPVVAGVNGFALGGGFETALACHWRVGSPSAKVGLPEVHLGILPGAGGTQRLPRLIGVEKSVEVMTTGRMIGSTEAFKLGIFDALAKSNASLEEEAVEFALSDLVLSTPLASRMISNRAVVLTEQDQCTNEEEFFHAIKSKVEAAARGFVAPGVIVDAIRASVCSGSFAAGSEREGELFQQLMHGSQAKALQYFFFSERRTASHIPNVPADTVPLAIKSAGVIGGGTMGAGIAMCFANAGIPTILVETDLPTATLAHQRIEKTYKASSAYKSGKQSDAEVTRLMTSITPAASQGSFQVLADVDIVVEAVFENMEIKKDIFAKLDRVCKREAVLASNTSYLDIDLIANATQSPARVIGTRESFTSHHITSHRITTNDITTNQLISNLLKQKPSTDCILSTQAQRPIQFYIYSSFRTLYVSDFFSPANVMKLLEVVRGAQSSAVAIATGMQLGKTLGKTAVLAGNCHGFIGNRMLGPYGVESQFLVEEGCSPTQVDRVLKQLGMAMGPFEVIAYVESLKLLIADC